MARKTRVALFRLGVVVLALFLWTPPAQPQAPTSSLSFQDVTASLIGSVMCEDPANRPNSGDWCAIAVSDWDRDGDDDFLLNIHPGTRFYRNNGNGTVTQIPSPLPPPVVNVTDHRHVFGFADLNGDGWDDLVVLTGFEAPNRVDLVMINNRDGTWTESAASLSLQRPGDDDQALSFLDINKDGRLDIFKARRTPRDQNVMLNDVLMVNLGSQFQEQTAAYGFGNRSWAKRPYAVNWTDLNKDGYPDGVGVGNNYNSWFFRQSTGKYTTSTGVYTGIVGLSPYLHDSEWADFDGDGRIDPAILDTFTTKQDASGASVDNSVLRIHQNTSAFNADAMVGMVNRFKTPDCFSCDGRSSAVGDFDNDGRPDIFLLMGGDPATKGREQLWMNNGGWSFTNRAAEAFSSFVVFYQGAGGTAVIDYDSDGRLDLIVSHAFLGSPGPFQVLRNVSTTGNSWIGFRRLPIGSRVEVTSSCGRKQTEILGGRTGWISQDSRTVHFGLGACPGSVSVAILRPDGSTQTGTVSPNAYYDSLTPVPTPTPTPAPSPTPGAKLRITSPADGAVVSRGAVSGRLHIWVETSGAVLETRVDGILLCTDGWQAGSYDVCSWGIPESAIGTAHTVEVRGGGLTAAARFTVAP